MKNVLAILGILALLGVLVVGVGGYYVYKKGSSKVVEVSEQAVKEFIEQKSPPQPVADSLNRLLNAVKLKKSWSNTYLVSVAVTTIEDEVVTEEEKVMLDDAAVLAEQGDLTKQEMTDFMKKHEKVLGRHRKKN